VGCATITGAQNFGNGACNGMTHYTQVSMDKSTVLFLGDVEPQTSKAGKHYSGGGTQALLNSGSPKIKIKYIFLSL